MPIYPTAPNLKADWVGSDIATTVDPLDTDPVVALINEYAANINAIATDLLSKVERVYETDIGNGAATSFDVVHGLNRAYPSSVTVWNKATGFRVIVDVTPLGANSVRIGPFGIVYPVNGLRVEISG